jgi:transposase
MSILAVDLGKSKSVACVFEPSSGEHQFETIASTPAAVLGIIEREKPQRVVIEVGPTAGWVCDLCREMGVPVEVANANHDAWRWRNVKRKSDRDDALKLARLSALGQLPPVHVPAPKVRAWRELIGYRHALVARLGAVKNSLRAILMRQAIAWPAGQAGWGKAALKELRELSTKGEEIWRMMLREELQHFATLAASIERIEQQLDGVAQQNRNVALLRSIPGVGPRLSEVIVAVIDDPHRFKSGKQVGCYAGLTPRRHQSGSMDRQGKISGAGHELLRSLLVEVAWISRRWNPWMKAVYEKALHGSKSRRKIAIVALARRLLIVCWAMLRDGKPWACTEAARLSLAA